MAVVDIDEYLKLVPMVKHSPRRYLWSFYDAEADTLYVSLSSLATRRTVSLPTMMSFSAMRVMRSSALLYSVPASVSCDHTHVTLPDRGRLFILFPAPG